MDIGFYIPNISNSQDIENILSGINEYIIDHPNDNVVVFTNSMNRMFNDKFYVLHLSHAKYFDGVLFVFDMKDCSITQTFPKPSKQIFYLKSLEWEKNRTMLYSFWKRIMLNKNIELVVDSAEKYDICEICWKAPIATVANLNKESIEDVLQKI
jgi:hypothetical protein